MSKVKVDKDFLENMDKYAIEFFNKPEIKKFVVDYIADIIDKIEDKNKGKLIRD